MGNRIREESVADIDWAPFDPMPENTIECRCGASYRSHSRVAKVIGWLTIVTRKPCPECGGSVGNVRSASAGSPVSEPDLMESVEVVFEGGGPL
jgi:hypothetical protein